MKREPMPSINMRNPFKRFLAPLWLLLIVLNCQMSFAQGKAPIEWSRFNLLSVDTIWKYQGGMAKPEYFEQRFDDQHWQTVNDQFLQLLSEDSSTWPGIGVFRKKFNVPDSLLGRHAELMLRQFGASEIYLDGKLVCRFGNVAGNAKEEITFVQHNPIQLELDNQSSHVLAIYYSNHSKRSIISRVGSKGFRIMLSPLNSAYEYSKDTFPHWIISMCIILSFCLFFCFVYGFYPYRLASLMSALYLANFTLIFAGANIRGMTNNIKYFIY